MDFPKVKSRPIINPRMEIFIAVKFDEFNADGNNHMAELDNLIKEILLK